MDPSKKKKSSWIRQLALFTRGQRLKLGASLLCAVVGVVGGIVPFFAAYKLIALSISDTLAISEAGHWALIALLGVAVQTIGYLASTSTSHSVAYHTLENLRNAACKHLAACSLGDVQSAPSGALKKIIIDDIEQMELPIAHVIPEFTSNVLLLILCFAIVCSIDIRLALSMLIAPALSIVPLSLLFKNFERDYAAYWTASERVNSTLVEYIDGIEVIKTFNQTDSSYARFRNDISEFEKLTLAWYKSARIPMNAMFAILPTLLLGVVPVGCILVASGSIDVAQMALACMLSIGVIGPLTKITQYTNMFKEIEKVMDSVSKLLEMKPLPEVSSPALITSHDVSFKNVRFSYSNEEVLHGISLEVPEGTSCALVGPSGSGKSTMAKLIARFWDAGSGAIRIGETNVRDIPLDQLAGLVSFVTQDNFLFDRTIFENVRLGREGATDAEVERALAAAHCEELADKLANGFETLSGEAGGALSGGERQRISIARAYLKDAPILVLDEATAFIDPESEELIQQALSELARGKTLIVIAHRISTVRNFDKIVVMDSGNIVAEGTHTDLLGSSDLYHRMWEAHISNGTHEVRKEQRNV